MKKKEEKIAKDFERKLDRNLLLTQAKSLFEKARKKLKKRPRRIEDLDLHLKKKKKTTCYLNNIAKLKKGSGLLRKTLRIFK